MVVKFSLLVLILCIGLSFGNELTLRLLTDAPQAMGARCLDGSPPGYFMRAGSGEGANKWVLHLMGGGWCTSIEECYTRSFGPFGSTSVWPQSMEFFGIFSSDTEVNPDFFNWNVVFLIYCDGGSFAGNRNDTDMLDDRQLYYRGYQNLQAIISDLNNEREMSAATDVILTGCSAGAVAVFIHADFVGTLVGNATYVALPDAGYFIDMPLANGTDIFQGFFTGLRTFHNIDTAIPPACKAANSGNLWRCLGATYLYGFIRTPIFVLNSQYDTEYLRGVYSVSCTPPDCTAEENTFIENYKAEFDRQVQPVLSSPSRNGYFLDSCFIHCQTIENDLAWNEVSINGITMAQSFGDWYFNRSSNTRLKDCDDAFPCNPTCPDLSGGAVKSTASTILLVLALYMLAL